MTNTIWKIMPYIDSNAFIKLTKKRSLNVGDWYVTNEHNILKNEFLKSEDLVQTSQYLCLKNISWWVVTESSNSEYCNKLISEDLIKLFNNSDRETISLEFNMLSISDVDIQDFNKFIKRLKAYKDQFIKESNVNKNVKVSYSYYDWDTPYLTLVGDRLETDDEFLRRIETQYKNSLRRKIKK